MVADFFGGSFEAAVVCRQTGRRYHGADTDEGCVSIGRKRVHETGASG
jgi:DNA modification methylase